MTTSSIIGSIIGFFAVISLLALASTGCNPQISCWYSSYANNQFAAPSFHLRGRTVGVLSTDISGPVFMTQAEMESYIQSHHLKLCAQN